MAALALRILGAALGFAGVIGGLMMAFGLAPASSGSGGSVLVCLVGWMALHVIAGQVDE